MPKLCVHIQASVLAFTVGASPVLGQEAGGACSGHGGELRALYAS